MNALTFRPHVDDEADAAAEDPVTFEILEDGLRHSSRTCEKSRRLTGDDGALGRPRFCCCNFVSFPSWYLLRQATPAATALGSGRTRGRSGVRRAFRKADSPSSRTIEQAVSQQHCQEHSEAELRQSGDKVPAGKLRRDWSSRPISTFPAIES